MSNVLLNCGLGSNALFTRNLFPNALDQLVGMVNMHAILPSQILNKNLFFSFLNEYMG